MFVPERLEKVRVICSRESVEDVVQALYDFGTVHIERTNVFSPDKPLESFKGVSEALIRLRAAENALGLGGKTRVKDHALGELLERMGEIGFAGLQKTLDELRGVREQIASLAQKKEELAPFRNLPVNPKSLKAKSVEYAYFLAKAPFEQTRNKLKKVSFEHLTVKDGKNEYVLLAFDKRDADKVNAFLSENASGVYAVPGVYENAPSFASAIRRLDVVLSNLRHSEAALEALKTAFAKAYGKEIVYLRQAFEIQAKKAELPSRFGASRRLSVVEAWAPQKLGKELDKKIAGVPEAVIERVATKETPPTKLKNPRAIMPFEFLIKALSLPKYDEIDPTILVSLTFPMFFGMILGDLGYGIAMLPIALFLRYKFKEGFFRDLSGIIVSSAIATIIFGVIYGEFFGFESVFGHELHPLINRAGEHGLDVLMNLCIVVGVLHLGAGFTIGALEAYKEKHYRHAAAKASWLAMELGLVGLLASASDVSLLSAVKPVAMALPLVAWEALAVLSLAGLMVFEGGQALFELPGLIGNIVSYLRIMALGVSGVILASMVNSIPLNFSLDFWGILSYALFAAFFVLGHAFALALGMFESAIQSLRLHYVEFFSKFYQGGGVAFVPLRYRKER